MGLLDSIIGLFIKPKEKEVDFDTLVSSMNDDPAMSGGDTQTERGLGKLSKQ